MDYKKQPSLFAAVVLYNTRMTESITCKSLLQIEYNKLHIIVIDNSTHETNNNLLCKDNGVKYISMKGNKGLSVAYNCVLEYLSDQNKDDFIIWLDQDTKISQDYFDTLIYNINKYQEFDIFAPIVYGQNGIIYSPNEANILKNKLMKSTSDIVCQSKFNAINSCLAVRLKVYKDYRYDEELFLDQVDQKFFDDLRKKKYKFFTLNTIIYQNFSQRETNLTSKAVWNRFQIRIIDMMKYCCKNWHSNFCGLIKVCGWGIQMGLKCNSLKLMWRCCTLGVRLFFTNCKSLVKY